MKKILFLTFLFFSIGASTLLLSVSDKKTPEIRSRAAGENTIIVPADSGAPGIQIAIDSAKDGDTIIIPAGKYSGGTAVPLASSRAFANNDRGGSETCFLRIEKKNITIKGNGVTLYGEGHAKPYQDPYQNRAGICVLNSTVTFEGLRVKEFQKRCVVAVDSTIVYKNGVVDGCDEGGISLLGTSKGLIINNIFVGFNFGGVMMWQDSQAKIVNNIFYNANVMFFYHSRNDDKAHAEIINNIFSNGSKVTQVSWWKEHADKIKGNTLSYNLFWGDKSPLQCDPAWDFCDNFPGKLEADPLLNDAAVDPTGWVYGSFDLRPESPAVGKGDSTIPGPKNLGAAGGPCTEPSSSTCTNFIAQNMPQPIQPTLAPTEVIPTSPSASNLPDNIPTNPPVNRPTDRPGDDDPPITYYLPPTMGFANPNQPTRPTEDQPLTEVITPTTAPTPKPLIDIGKTVENAKNSLNNFWVSVLNFTKTILP